MFSNLFKNSTKINGVTVGGGGYPSGNVHEMLSGAVSFMRDAELACREIEERVRKDGTYFEIAKQEINSSTISQFAVVNYSNGNQATLIITHFRHSMRSVLDVDFSALGFAIGRFKAIPLTDSFEGHLNTFNRALEICEMLNKEYSGEDIFDKESIKQ